MPDLSLPHASIAATTLEANTPLAFTFRFAVEAAIVFDVDISLDIVDEVNDRQVLHTQLASAGWDVSWLPASMAYKAALDLVLKGLEQPSGYTEPLLHAWRLNVKATASLTPLSS